MQDWGWSKATALPGGRETPQQAAQDVPEMTGLGKSWVKGGGVTYREADSVQPQKKVYQNKEKLQQVARHGEWGSCGWQRASLSSRSLGRLSTECHLI